MFERVSIPPSRRSGPFAYLAMLAAAVGVFFLIRAQGERLVATDQGHLGSSAPQAADALAHLLLALIAVITLARVLGAIFRKLGQPPVVAEVVAGILLGPSLLGRLAPGATAFILPPQSVPLLGVTAQLGVIIYMFLVGLNLDGRALRKQGSSSIAVSHASIVVPFLVGSALALPLYPRLSSPDVPFTVFALFLAASMSVTAFPVLARVLTDRGLRATRIGTIALACAAVDDVTAWCLLALVVSIVQARPARVLFTLALVGAFTATMLTIVRPLVVRLARAHEGKGSLDRGQLAAVFLAVFACALATEAIGVHALFGAFLLGAVIPNTSAVARDLTSRIEDLVVVLFLPAFFALTGIRTHLDLIQGWQSWLLCLLITAGASLGKLGGTSVVARMTGLSWREAMGLGVLMNTRGLMELIVLNVGLELGVISPRLFTMLVLMAIATTAMTGPLLSWIRLGDGATTRAADRGVPELGWSVGRGR